MGKRLKETFLQRRFTNGQQAYEKPLGTTRHHSSFGKCRSKPHGVLGPHAIKTQEASAGEDADRPESAHCWCVHKRVQLPWKTGRQFLEKLKIELLFDPTIPLLGIQPRNGKQGLREIFVDPCSWQCYSQQQRGGAIQVPIEE